MSYDSHNGSDPGPPRPLDPRRRTAHLTETKKPKSVGGRRWVMFQRHDIPDVTAPGIIYLRRYILLMTPYFSIYLHKIMRPDGDRNLHDHPWSFLALILKGGYTEEVGTNMGDLAQLKEIRTWRRGSGHRLMRGQFHRISTLLRVPTWTLCLLGPRRGDWGFYDLTPSPDGPRNGWVQWETYLDRNYPGWR